MIRHQYVTVNDAFVSLCSQAQVHQVAPAILVAEKHAPPIIAALDDMKRQARNEDAWFARHANSVAQAPALYQSPKMGSDPI
jgi:hypothetical protein